MQQERSVIKCNQTCKRREEYNVSLILLTCTYFQSLKSHIHQRGEENTKSKHQGPGGGSQMATAQVLSLNLITISLIPLRSGVFYTNHRNPHPQISDRETHQNHVCNAKKATSYSTEAQENAC